MDHLDHSESDYHQLSDADSIRVGMTRVGKGIFARRSYPKSAIVGEITGEFIDDENYGSEYCFEVGEGLRLEPLPPFRFVNHSCEENCEFDYLVGSQQFGSERCIQVYLCALRDIERGEELTIDYNWSAAHAIPCHCQTASCRGWIMAFV